MRFIFLLLSLTLNVFAQTSNEIRDIIKFGLENQVLDMLRQLTLQKDLNFTNEIEALLTPYQSFAVREAVLRYFSEVKKSISKEKINLIVNDLDKWPNSLVLTFSNYIVSLEAKDLFQYFEPMLHSDSIFQEGAAIRLIGQLKLNETAETLFEKLKKPETPPELIGDLVVALGRLNHQPASEEIKRIFEDGSSSAALKALCLEALSRLDNSTSQETFLIAFQDENAIVRSAALKQAVNMKNYPLNLEIYLRALRDTSPNVRLAAAEALAERQLEGTFEMLIFRASQDPDNKVRQAALNAIKKQDETYWRKQVVDLIKNRRGDPVLWGNLLKEVFENRLSEALEVIQTILNEESRFPNSPLLNHFALQFSLSDWNAVDNLIPIILKSQNQNAQLTILRTLQRRERKDLRPLLVEIERTTRFAQVRNFLQTLLRQWE